MAGVVVATVAEVDPAHERDVVVGTVVAPDHEQLLVVAAAASHPLVEQDLAARLVDRLDERVVLLFGEVRLTRVRAPQQPRTCTPRRARSARTVADLRPRPVEAFVGIALPVGEVHPVVAPERLQSSRAAGSK